MKLFLATLLGLILLTGCTATPQIYLSQEPVAIENSELRQYWVEEHGTFTMSFPGANQPKPGMVKISYVIDSNGNIFNPEIVESTPAGMWDRGALAALKNMRYRPAEQNPSKIPVRVTTEFEFKG